MTHKTAWHWLRTQYFSHLRGDLAGGLASAMTSLPGNIIRGTIAFAPLGEAYAGAGVLAGLYGTVFAGLVTAVCGSTPGIISGSYAASVAVFSAVVGQLWATGAWNQEPITGPAAVMTLAFLMVLLSGVVQVAFGVLRFGNLIRYISYPVVAGIVNGTAILFLKGAFWGYLGMPTTTPDGIIRTARPHPTADSRHCIDLDVAVVEGRAISPSCSRGCALPCWRNSAVSWVAGVRIWRQYRWNASAGRHGGPQSDVSCRRRRHPFHNGVARPVTHPVRKPDHCDPGGDSVPHDCVSPAKSHQCPGQWQQGTDWTRAG